MEVIIYHGTPDKITKFDPVYSGDTTANNDYDCFFFSDNLEVAKDYSRQSFIRRYEDRDLEDLVNYSELTPEQIKGIIEDLEDFAETQIKVVKAKVYFSNPLIIDLKNETIDCVKIQEMIGHLKGKCHCDDIFELVNEQFSNYFNEDTDEYLDIPEFDGLIIKNCIDDIGWQSQQLQTEYVVFNSYQIQIMETLTKFD